MNLNIEVICHQLKKEYTVLETQPPRDIPLSGPLLYDGAPFLKNCLYLLEATDFAFLEAFPADIALIVTGMAPAQQEQYPCDILFIQENVPFQRMFNKIAGIFGRLNAWEQELLQYEGDYGKIQNMLACSHDILGGTLTLVDDSFNLLAFTDDLPGRPKYFDSNMPTRTPRNLIEDALEDPDYRASLRKREVFLYPEYSCAANALCCNLFQEGEEIYYARLILMNEANSYSGEQAFLLRFLSGVIHRTLSRASAISMVRSAYQGMGELIRRVLKEPPKNVSAVLPTLQGVSWGRHDGYVVTALSNPFERHRAIQDRSFCNQLEIVLEETCALIYGENIVLVSNIGKSTGMTKEKFDSRLTIFLRENLFKAGVSKKIQDFTRLSVGYREALAALELGNAREPSLWCYQFGSYVIPYIIQASAKDVPFEDMMDERLLMLLEHDRKTGSQLFETLKTYIRCKYNVTRSSEAMYVHRTTFLSRLDRILQLTQLDLEDWDTRLILMLSIHALENG